MNIITGTARGRKLLAPKGEKTRPTTQRIKESIFNIVQFDIEGRQVLDCFAGCGQIGLEALSRGAAGCIFCETEREALAAIEQNIASTGLPNAKVFPGDVLRAIPSIAKKSVGLVFLDPPFGADLLEKTLNSIFLFDIMIENGIIVCESAKDKIIAPPPEGYFIHREYVYGNIKITTIVRGVQ